MLQIDDIVFNQKQLDRAIEQGHTNICLCDNSFNLPSTDGISYMGIGDVRAVIRLDRERRYNISFEGFEPAIIYTGGYTGITEQVTEEIVLPAMYGSFGSFGSYGSYMTSYFSLYGSAAGLGLGPGSGSGSYKLRSSYFTSGSVNTSFKSSYATSYVTSYATSFASSYTFSGSALLLLCAPYCEECSARREIFYAAGYGLDLI